MTARLVLFYLYLPITAGAAVIGVIRFRQLSINLRFLAGLLWVEVPIELAARIIGLRNGNNLFLMPIYTVAEYTMLALTYGQTLKSSRFNKIAPWLIGGFTAYALFDSFHTPGILSAYQPGQQVVQSLLILGLVALYFRKLLNDLQVEKLSLDPMFWVSVGITLYFLGYLQIALFSNYLLRNYSSHLFPDIWMVENVLHIFLHLCYAYALWMRPQK